MFKREMSYQDWMHAFSIEKKDGNSVMAYVDRDDGQIHAATNYNDGENEKCLSILNAEMKAIDNEVDLDDFDLVKINDARDLMDQFC